MDAGPRGPLGTSLLALPRQRAIPVPELDMPEQFLITRLLSVQHFVGMGTLTAVLRSR